MLRTLLSPFIYVKDAAVGGLHMLIPNMGQGNAASPPSSPSTTPISSRRRTSSRKSRLKPRSRKSTKQCKPASADISTQETTTPGPNSSDTTDTDSHDETHPGPCRGESCDHNGFPEDRQSHSGTPNLPSASTDSSSHLSGSEASGGLEYSSALEDPLETAIFKCKGDDINSKNSSVGNRVPENGVSVSKFNSDENLHRDSCETSDTDKKSMPPQQYSSSVQRKLRTPWAKKRFDSDFSTAPLSSETSDMDTSGHEKVGSDGGSTSDLTSLSHNSRSDLSSEAFSTSVLQQPLPSVRGNSAQPFSVEKNEPKKGERVQNYAVLKKAVTTTATASPPVAKRPLKASLSTPLKASPKLVSVAVESRNSVAAKVPPRPKPPLAAKPAVKPKPPILASTGRSGSNSPPALQQRTKLHCYSVGDTDAVDYAPVSVGNLSKSEQKIPPLVGGSRGQLYGYIRKSSSESNVLSGTRAPTSPTFVPRKLSNVREECEDKDGDSDQVKTRPTRISPTPRPHLLPTKSKLPATALRRHSPTPPPKPRTSPKSSPTQPRGSPITTAASPSSEATSSLPSSLLIVKRKLVPPNKPKPPPKKPFPLHQSASAGSLLSPYSSTGSSVSTLPHSDIQVSTNKGDKDCSTPPAKPHTKRRPYGREISVPTQFGQSQGKSPSVSPSASPTPPLLPPRSPVFQHRDKEKFPGSLTLSQPLLCTTSSSSQEEILPIPLRIGEGTPETPSSVDAASKTALSPADSGTEAPPVLRKLKPSQREGTPPAVGKKIKSPPRRPPPCPPLSPSPPPFPTHTKTIGRSSVADTCTTDPASPKRHSLFSPALSKSQIRDVSQAYEVFDRDSEKSKELEKLYQQSVLSADSSVAEKNEKFDINPGESSPSRNRKPPHTTHYELTFFDPEKQSKPPKRASESSSITSPVLSDDLPPPLPSQPIPKKKDRQQLLKRGPIKAVDSVGPQSHRNDDGGTKRDTQSFSSGSPAPKNRVYDMIDDLVVNKATKSPRFFKKLTRNESKELSGSFSDLRSSEASFRRETKSFSSYVFRRSNSDRFKKNKVTRLPTAGNVVPTTSHQTVHRTPSVDKLDDRMERSVRLSSPKMEGDSSSDEEEEETASSPTQQGLPQPPLPRYTESPKPLKRAERPGSAYMVPADEEPLYQYINTAEFLRTPQENARTGLSKNQLDIARQLSSRRLWCEQPEIIKSGLLEDLSEDEKKLQEAIFEVVTTEATYLRSLDVLIDHFMEDPGMNPNLPEGRRVLDKRQHHVIFSNVQEVREISARFLEELRGRQNETAIIKGIADIVLNYAENKFDCYVRYCTNQIYQTRELQECIERNTMFREYLRRLESHRKCQHLSMQSFLLLPMQRITRLPLLILAILNKTPLDHKDHSLVEKSLRTVQKLVTECNDGARKMERTEQLHNIHQQLDFGKLKPFPLVSVSRQLEKRGTVLRLRVEQKLFGRNQIKRKQLYLFVFTDMIIITKRKKDPKGEYVYKVVDYSSRAVVEMEDIGVHPGMTFPKHTFGEQDTVANATWAVSTAGERHAFLIILLDNIHHHSEKYIFVAQNDTDKTRWMESLATPESQREDEKIYQTWDCPQVQAIYDYKAAQPDELSLERGDVVKVYRKMADGWYEGERLRDLRWGWFPSNFTTEIENEHTRARNLRETHRLLSLQYSPEEYAAKITTIR